MLNKSKATQIYDSFCSFLIIIFPAALITGPVVPEFIMFFLSFFFLFENFKYNNFKFKNLFLYFVIAFQFVIFLSIFNTSIQEVKVLKNIFYFRYFIFALSISYFIKKDISINKKILFVFFIIYLLFIFDSIFQFLLDVNILGFELYKPNNFTRVSSFFGDELVMGSFFSRLFPLVLSLIFITYDIEKNNNAFYFSFLILVATIVLILFSGERVAFFNFIFFIFLFVLYDFNNKTKKKLLYFIILLCCLFLFSFKNFSERIIFSSYQQIFKTYSVDEGEFLPSFKYFSDQHHAHAVTALKIFKDNIFIGSGPQSFRYLCSDKKYQIDRGCATHPHSTYLQILSELGIFGFLLLCALFLYLLNKLLKIILNSYKFKANSKSYSCVCILILFIFNLWPILPSGNFFNNWMSMIYYFPLGFFLSNNFKMFKKY